MKMLTYYLCELNSCVIEILKIKEHMFTLKLEDIYTHSASHQMHT